MSKNTRISGYAPYRREVFHYVSKMEGMGVVKKGVEIDYKKLEIEHEIPGWVELPKNECGGLSSFKVRCVDCGYESRMVHGKCDDPKCFVCHVKWSKKKAFDGALRVLEGIRQMKLKGVSGDPWHFTMSPPENADGKTVPRSEKYVDDIIKEVYDLCKKNGIVGGLLVVHYGPERKDNGWEKYLPKGGYRPHIHVYGYGKRPRGPWFNKRGMWVVVTLNDKKDGDGNVIEEGRPIERDFGFIRNGLQYQFSHAMRRVGRHAIRWFGEWSYSKGIGTKKELEAVGLRQGWIERKTRNGCDVICKCPECGGDMINPTVLDTNGMVWVNVRGKPPPCPPGRAV